LGQACTQAFQILLSTRSIPNLGSPQDPNVPIPYITLTSGDYDGVLNGQGRTAQELFIAQSRNGNGGPNQGHQLLVYSFAPDLAPTLRNTGFFGFSSILVPDQPFLASGRLAWFGQVDQVVFSSTQTLIISVITFDPATLAMTGHNSAFPIIGNDSNGPLYGLAVGRFDPPDINASQKDFNLQIAALFEKGWPPNIAPNSPERTVVQLFTCRYRLER
jgi:hypothetical protein